MAYEINNYESKPIAKRPAAAAERALILADLRKRLPKSEGAMQQTDGNQHSFADRVDRLVEGLINRGPVCVDEISWIWLHDFCGEYLEGDLKDCCTDCGEIPRYCACSDKPTPEPVQATKAESALAVLILDSRLGPVIKAIDKMAWQQSVEALVERGIIRREQISYLLITT